jgi:hypothetical protein
MTTPTPGPQWVKFKRNLPAQRTVTKYNGTLRERYECYLINANDGNGCDITRPGMPLKTFEEWINS